MRRYLRKFKLYALLPEMQLFWVFLPTLLVFGALIYFSLPFEAWIVANIALFALLGVVILINSLRLAKLNLEIKVERNELWSIINNLRDGIIAYDTEFKILVFNKAAEAIFGIKTEEVSGKIFPGDSFRGAKSQILTQVMFPSLAPVAISRSAPGDPVQTADLSFENPRVELRVTSAKIIDPAGKLLGFVKIVHDRTRELEILRSKTEFVTIAAHQLRTPLSGILWALQTMLKEKLGESVRELAENSLKASDKLLKIVNDLLDVAGIEEGRFGYRFEEIELVGFIEKILAEAAEFSERFSVKIFFEKPEEELVITGDTARLSLAMNNILDNAIKYNIKNGKVTVRVEKLANAPFIKISISDTGLGVPPEDIDRMFSKFFRAENVMRKETMGSGLGLYITKNIVMRHGGEVWLDSELNRGTTVSFTLPTDPKLIPPKGIVYEEY